MITRAIAGKEMSFMTTFTIDSDDHIAATPSDRKPEGADPFSSLDELGQVTEQWPASRLVRGLISVLPKRSYATCHHDFRER